MRWLDLAAAVIGDEPVSETFRDAVCRSYADNIYMRPQSESTMDLQNAIKRVGLHKVHTTILFYGLLLGLMQMQFMPISLRIGYPLQGSSLRH